jgi:hypothetical protein
MTKWEYQVVSILAREYGPDNMGLKELTDLGNEGWDLVSVVQPVRGANDPYDGSRLLFIFKRPSSD